MGEASAQLEIEVRELVRDRGVDPVRDRLVLRALVGDALDAYDERALRGQVPPLIDRTATGKALEDAVGGLGPLQQYLDDDSVEEVWVNSPPVCVRAGQSPAVVVKSAGSPQDASNIEAEAARVRSSAVGHRWL